MDRALAAAQAEYARLDRAYDRASAKIYRAEYNSAEERAAEKEAEEASKGKSLLTFRLDPWNINWSHDVTKEWTPERGWTPSLPLFADSGADRTGLRKAHREAWAAFHRIANRAEAERRALREEADSEKAEAVAVFEAAVAEAQGMYDAAGVPAVLAFEAAAKSEEAARERLAWAAPEAWAAFVATLARTSHTAGGWASDEAAGSAGRG